ncbi:MAG: xylulokinase [Phycisphaerae bacterium]|nr:xylulokinase [Phycisphaerae bacterium]
MLLLGIDLGTSGTKAVIVDERSRVVASATREHPVNTPRPGWSEQDPEEWWRSTIAAVRAALASPSVRARDVGAIGLSGQMHGLVMLGAGGEILRPCILWNDQRSAPQCERIERELGVERVVELTGNRMLPGFMAPKILWCREHEPQLERRAATHLLPKDWLRYRMSGVPATEVSDASGTALFDCGKRCWSAEMLTALRIARTTLPECAESPVVTAQLAGNVASELGLAPGIPIVGGAGDQAAAAIGAGIVREGRVSVNIGTSGVVFAACDAWRPAPRGELHAFCHAVPERWHVMGVMLSAGGSLRWYRDTIARIEAADAYDRLATEASTIVPGADGLTFLPYLTGERCPHSNPNARGAFVGLSTAHSRAHLTRAVFEGITFGLRDNLDLARSLGVTASTVELSGGGGRSAFWRQLCADVFQTPVAAARGDEGGGFGVALLAGVGAGVWKSVDAAVDAAATSPSDVTLPQCAKAYDLPYARFRALYADLSGAFERSAVAQQT